VEQEGDTVLIFGECSKKRENRAKAQDKLRRSAASLERQQKLFAKDFHIREVWKFL
jgi:hypothetical protein